MMKRYTLYTLLLCGAAAVLGCGDEAADRCPLDKPMIRARALSATQLELMFGCEVDEDSASSGGNYLIEAGTQLLGTGEAVKHPTLAVQGVRVDGAKVTLTTATMTALVPYTLRLAGVQDAAGNTLSGSINFTGVGGSNHGKITFTVDDRYNQILTSVRLLVSFDPLTGVFSHQNHTIYLDDKDKDYIFTGLYDVAVDPSRTADTSDDRLGAAYMAYTVRAVDSQNRPLSKLVLFEVADTKAQTVKVQLTTVPDKPPVEGRVKVTFEVDDRQAQALTKPTLKASLDKDGKFDANFSTVIALSDNDGDDVWTGSAQVWIDPNRKLTGSTTATKPYSAHLLEGKTPYTARSVDFVVPEEKAVTAKILVGSTAKVPVVFRVDVSKAWLDTDGTNKGVWTGESVFLTGEFGTAEDAFGQNASDSFSGGENVVLQMVERTDHKGVWERTLFLPKSATERPYGWKVVRCPTDQGCTQLNKMVTSSGRAFPTVMKNLITEMCDASKKTWTDKNCKSPKLIDPRSLTSVNTGGSTLNYASAKVWQGTIKEGVETDPAGTPKATLMFKQEITDLIVNVKDKAVETPVHVIGTWRDVNITGSPKDIIAGGSVIKLAVSDYDAGMTGVAPPSYKLAAAPRPSPFKMDGVLDGTAKLLAGGTTGGGTMPIHAAISGDHLYLATDDAGEGSDNFFLLSATAPTATPTRPCPWAKAGKVAFTGKTLFMADENDFSYAAWFELASAVGGNDKQLAQMGVSNTAGLDVFTPATNGGKLEGTVNLKTVFGSLPSAVYVMTAPWGNANGGKMYHPAQTPKTQNGDGNVDKSEILKIALPSLKVSQP